MLYTITLGHVLPEILETALRRYRETAELESEHILVDHHWPLDYWKTRHKILDLAEKYGCRVMSPLENLGGHGGVSWVLKNLPLKPEDVVIGYDSDSNPAVSGWDKAAIDVLSADPSLAIVSLASEFFWATPGRDHTEEKIAGHTVVFPDDYAVQNVTILKGSYCLAVGEIRGLRNFYGYTENIMWAETKKRGWRMGWLKDYHEDHCPIPHHPWYVDWKWAHAHHNTHSGNFDEYVAARVARGETY